MSWRNKKSFSCFLLKPRMTDRKFLQIFAPILRHNRLGTTTSRQRHFYTFLSRTDDRQCRSDKVCVEYMSINHRLCSALLWRVSRKIRFPRFESGIYLAAKCKQSHQLHCYAIHPYDTTIVNCHCKSFYESIKKPRFYVKYCTAGMA
jgi:hypothetical protein